MHFHNSLLLIGIFTFILLSIMVLVFDLGMSFGKIKCMWRSGM